MNKKISTPIGIVILVSVAVIFGGGILVYQNGWISKFYISTPVAEKPLITAEEKVTPFIKVISPNGGENWIFNITNDIKWESYGIDAVSINLMVYYDRDYDFMVIANGVPANIGKYSYQIKSQLPLIIAEKFKIQIIGYNNGSKLTDESDKDFFIKEAIADANLQKVAEIFCKNRDAIVKYFSLINFGLGMEKSILLACGLQEETPDLADIAVLTSKNGTYSLFEEKNFDSFLSSINNLRGNKTKPEIIDVDNDGTQEILYEGGWSGGTCTGGGDVYLIYSPKYKEVFRADSNTMDYGCTGTTTYSFVLSPSLQNINYQAFKAYIEKFKTQ